MTQGGLCGWAIAGMQGTNAKIEKPFRETRIELCRSLETLLGLRIFFRAQKLQTVVELCFPAP